ncbi:F-box domain-containing protein [Mycena sanguinolenta]|uniref:F-box domain-containing protein n=1 Tax=Mycena sanguinolenta TaxID=230812 RepID=A0A8H7CS24_9AGAR|nr:F-box domain-containing protein [Mycena sanguinolenta]
MSSIITIQNRIEELSSAIERQKQILRDLEISRSDARRELNAARDPMGRLPVEISSDIFMRSLPDYYSHPITPSFYDAPVLFLRICHLWSEIALATPSLWAEICFDFDHDSGPNATDSKNRLARWIARAGTFPLNLSLGGHLASGVDIIQQYAHRMPTLDLRPSSLKGLGQISFSSLLALRISGYTSPKNPPLRLHRHIAGGATPR